MKYIFVNKDSDIPEVKFIGYVGLKEGIDYESLEAELREIAENNSELIIRINSGGGDVMEGFAIYDLVRGLKLNVTTIVEGMAASMATPIMLAGDKIKMTKYSRVMIHKVQGLAMGESHTVRNFADEMDSVEEQIKNIIIERTGQNQEVVDGWMKKGEQTWFSSDEAKSVNLVDEVIEPSKQRVSTNQNINSLGEKEAWEQVFKNVIDPEPKNETMERKHLINKLNLPEDATDEQIDKALDELNNKASQNQDPPADPPKGDPNKETNEEKEEMVNNAIEYGETIGVITNENKENWRKALNADFKANLAIMKDIAKSKGNETGESKESLADVIKQLADKNGNGDGNGNQEKWDYMDWAKNDPKGLENMRANEPEKYQKLVNEYRQKMNKQGVNPTYNE